MLSKVNNILYAYKKIIDIFFTFLSWVTRSGTEYERFFFYYSKEFCKDDVSTSLCFERVRYDIHGHESIASYDDDISWEDDHFIESE